MNNVSCDELSLIPEGCYPCKNKVNIKEYCASDTGKYLIIKILTNAIAIGLIMVNIQH